MNRFREKHPDYPNYRKKAPRTYRKLTDDDEVSEAAEDIYSVAAGHRETVKAKDAAAKARRRKVRG